MACSLNYQIIYKNAYLSKVIYPLVLTPSRLYCSKNDDPSSKSEKSSDDAPKKSEKMTKTKEVKGIRDADKTHNDLRMAAKQQLLEKTPDDIRAAAKRRLMNSIVPDNLKAAARKKPVDLRSAAREKLMNMLKDSNEQTDFRMRPTLNLARPVKRIAKKERLRIMQENQITPEKEMDMAVKNVASTFKKDTDKIESDLKQKLNSLDLSTEAAKDSPVGEETKFDDKISENVMSSVKEVAATISESPIPARSVLADRLLRMSLNKKAVSIENDKKVVPTGKKDSMKSLIEKLRTEREAKLSAVAKKSFVPQEPIAKRPSIPKIDLFGSSPLNIFDLESETKPAPGNELWQMLQQKELNLLVQFAPANGFEEMIMWTEQGKHWKFPIDNETEMGAEEKIGFNEHVFLEKHLAGFPTQGPIRHFMELVCVGLSKNPYITVERKIENIEWFRNYFKEKEDILRHTGAIE